MTVSNLLPLTYSEVKQFAADWYSKLDVHAPLEEYVPLLAEEGLEMRFPETTVYGFDGFKDWYERVIRIFFDEVHTLKKVEPKPISDAQLEVKVVVRWEASVWNPPAAKSERIVLDAYQTWIVERSPKTEKPTILTYIVDSLDYAPGSAKL
ncbi:hypothetical protein IQ238_27710 [Pleurocapsales cyanobacterium LEGE 06147]|nr:hypothetical protein [Pleurocapsales cyanobacterium LEGE 06147]